MRRPLDESNGQNSFLHWSLDNDVDPVPWESSALTVGSHTLAPVEIHVNLLTIMTPQRDTFPPPCSPFLIPQLLLAHLFWFLGYTCRSSIFAGRKSFLLLLVALPVLPVCGHRSDNLLRDRILKSKIHFDPLGTRTLGKLGFSSATFPLRSSAVHCSQTYWAWYCISRSGSTFPFGYLPPCLPWDKVGRIGEAINPGPPFQITTLNVVSIGKYQDLLVEPHPVPTVSVYTETCLTKTIFETISRKVKRAGRHLIVSGICDPRKGRTRQASVVRGESGGTLVASDLPARPSRHPLPSAALLSTRVCEAIVSPNCSFSSG